MSTHIFCIKLCIIIIIYICTLCTVHVHVHVGLKRQHDHCTHKFVISSFCVFYQHRMSLEKLLVKSQQRIGQMHQMWRNHWTP